MKRQDIAKDIFEKCGAFVSIADIARYGGVDRKTAARLTIGLIPIGRNTVKKYFYMDIADRISGSGGAA